MRSGRRIFSRRRTGGRSAFARRISAAATPAPSKAPWGGGPQVFFTPWDWGALDERDADLGGSNPLLLKVPLGEVPSSAGSKLLVLALGKDARAYLLDGGNLGGIGGSLASQTVSTRSIRTAPAA